MGTIVKLLFGDGIIGRMQFDGDVTDTVVTEALATTKFSHGPVATWQRSTLSELAPLITAQATPAESSRDPLAEIDELTARLKSARSFDDLAAIEAKS